MTIDQILKELRLENLECEYKAHLNRSDPLSWAKSIVGFANGEGGAILVGVSDDRVPFGIDEREVDSSKTLVYETLDRNILPKPIVRFETAKVSSEPAKYVLAIFVSKAESLIRYRTGDYSEKVFVRKDGSTPPSTVDEIMAMSRRAIGIDSEPTAANYSRDGYALFLSLCRKYRDDHAEPTEEDLISSELLTPNGCVRSGFAMFSDSYSGQDSLVACRLWGGTERIGGATLDRKKYKGPLGECFSFIMAFLERNVKEGYRKNDGIGRTTLRSYPVKVLQEAVVNAIAHRDYSIYGTQIDVDLFSDRIEITSPGNWPLPNPPEDYEMTRIPSVRRNPIICNAFEVAGLMEEDGTGFKTISNAYSTSPASKQPILERLPGFFCITLFDLLSPSKPDADIEISPVQRSILNACDCEEGKTSAELLPMSGMVSKPHFLSEVLYPLMKAGLIERVGPIRSPKAKYRLIK